MVAVLAIWIILLAIILAIGDAFSLLFARARENEVLSISCTFFIGLTICSIIACSLSLFTPLTSTIFVILLVFSILYWIINRERFWNTFQNLKITFLGFSIWGRAFALFIGFVVLYHSSSFSSSFDQFLYHQQHIKWLQEYGVVKGLANLHFRFGFNSSSLSITSLLAYHPDLKISFTALNGLVLFIFTAWLTKRFLKSKDFLSGFIYTVTLVVFTHFYAMELSSTSTDILVNILVAYLLLNCLLGENREDFYLPLAILPIFCVTLKLSSAPIVIISLYAYYHLINKKQFKTLSLALATSALITISWLAQNILLTGYLIFPFPDIDLFSFDWKVPSDIVTAEKINTYNWAKGIGADNNSTLGWMPEWFKHLPLMDKSVYTLAFIAIILSVLRLRKILGKNLFTIGYMTAIVGTLFGFITAPALRFSLGFTLPLIFFCLYIFFHGQTKPLSRRSFYTLQWIFLGAFIVFHIQYIGFKVKEKVELGSVYLKAQYIKPFPISYAITNTEFDSIKVDNIQIYISKDGACSDHVLPCTNSIITNLELRGEDIENGFRIKQD